MATQVQIDRLRQDIGATVSSLSDSEADDIFDEAEEEHTDTASIKTLTRVIAINRLLANAAKLTDYAQNQSREKGSQIFSHLVQLREIWYAQYEAAVAKTGDGVVKIGALRAKQVRREFPDADFRDVVSRR